MIGNIDMMRFFSDKIETNPSVKNQTKVDCFSYYCVYYLCYTYYQHSRKHVTRRIIYVLTNVSME